jgi:hypothetical protein
MSGMVLLGERLARLRIRTGFFVERRATSEFLVGYIDFALRCLKLK